MKTIPVVAAHAFLAHIWQGPPGKKVTAIKLYAKDPGDGRGTPYIMGYTGMCHSTEVFRPSDNGRAMEDEKLTLSSRVHFTLV